MTSEHMTKKTLDYVGGYFTSTVDWYGKYVVIGMNTRQTNPKQNPNNIRINIKI